ncbi:MAG: nucleotide pyrophosphohydrolase [Sphingobacteriales bacterium]|jgi:NTP pyrophosphatase (non-canonical NTP hydrolase)|nr:nucleotide pyrophosphohydrolase [Sphingobacteriales bacterium]MBK6890729.1 nucleotide pyrophosphohydrolase [Sphingobacteriales bacterium]MBK7526219.1 nucleotide pyrophosphohydrolase [Sphingobacteriales bacterium]MBK8677934.1 nucleotide pyrophosphohydrolase [Sphingobacteriales bacterium]MBL0247186.1 nucleotide pyrophosphohydrolase [Sphingobacteriales bacterium]
MPILSDDITLRQYQQSVHQWITSTGVRYFNELTNMAILTEEVGEVARIMARLHGEQSFKPNDDTAKAPLQNLADEMADVLFVLTCIANQTGIDLTEAAHRNFAKKTNRDAQRHQLNQKLNPPQLPTPQPPPDNAGALPPPPQQIDF